MIYEFSTCIVIPTKWIYSSIQKHACKTKYYTEEYDNGAKCITDTTCTTDKKCNMQSLFMARNKTEYKTIV